MKLCQVLFSKFKSFYQLIPSRHNTLTHCCIDVGPPSPTLAQHQLINTTLGQCLVSTGRVTLWFHTAELCGIFLLLLITIIKWLQLQYTLSRRSCIHDISIDNMQLLRDSCRRGCFSCIKVTLWIPLLLTWYLSSWLFLVYQGDPSSTILTYVISVVTGCFVWIKVTLWIPL